LAAKVMTWLIMHVGREDQKIGEFLRTKEAQQ
jgi:hemerythrin